MKNTAKKILSHDFFLPVVGSKRFIFLYHDIAEETEKHYSDYYYSTTPESFKRQIAFLARKFELIPLESLVTDTGLSRKKHYASIVFDDGFLSVAEIARKILDAEQIPFALFVNKSAMLFDQLWLSNLIIHKDDQNYLQKLYKCLTNKAISYQEFMSSPIPAVNEYIIYDKNFRETYLHPDGAKEKRVYLNTEEVRQLHNDGILIGSHSTDHYRMGNCTDTELSTQIVENLEFLKDLLKTEIEHFSLPFGKKEHYDRKVIEQLFANGHKFIYSTNIVSFEADKINKPDFLFPRLGILNQTPEELMFNINRTFVKKYDQ